MFHVHGTLILSSTKQWVHTDWLIDFAHIVTEIFRCKGTHTQTEFNSSQNVLINLLFDRKIRSTKIEGQNMLCLMDMPTDLLSKSTQPYPLIFCYS